MPMSVAEISRQKRRAEALKKKREEREKALKSLVDGWFKEFDTDGNGLLDREELRALLTHVQPNHPPTDEALTFLIMKATEIDTYSMKIKGDANGSISWEATREVHTAHPISIPSPPRNAHTHTHTRAPHSSRPHTSHQARTAPVSPDTVRMRCGPPPFVSPLCASLSRRGLTALPHCTAAPQRSLFEILPPAACRGWSSAHAPPPSTPFLLPTHDPILTPPVLRQTVLRYRDYVRDQVWIDAVFSRHDFDGSGELEKHELLPLLRELAPEADADAHDVDYIMEKCDADGNGAVSRGELLPMVSTWRHVAVHKTEERKEKQQRRARLWRVGAGVGNLANKIAAISAEGGKL